MPKTKQFRLKDGAKNHSLSTEGGNFEVVTPGTVVSLTEAQAKAFADKFEPVDGKGFAEAAPVQAKLAETGSGKVEADPTDKKEVSDPKTVAPGAADPRSKEQV